MVAACGAATSVALAAVVQQFGWHISEVGELLDGRKQIKIDDVLGDFRCQPALGWLPRGVLTAKVPVPRKISRKTTIDDIGTYWTTN